jgi:hypothetical protein
MSKSKHQLSYSGKIPEWKNFGKSNGFNYLAIIQDIEDNDYYPEYFTSVAEFNKFDNNIISEHKIKVIELLTI